MKYHKLGDLKRQKGTPSQFWRRGVQNQGLDRVSSFLGMQRENLFPASLLVSGGGCHRRAPLDLYRCPSDLCLSCHMVSLSSLSLAEGCCGAGRAPIPSTQRLRLVGGAREVQIPEPTARVKGMQAH